MQWFILEDKYLSGALLVQVLYESLYWFVKMHQSEFYGRYSISCLFAF